MADVFDLKDLNMNNSGDPIPPIPPPPTNTTTPPTNTTTPNASDGGNVDTDMVSDINDADADADAVTGGSMLGAVLTPKVLTPLVLTVASVAAAKRLRRMTGGKQTRKFRGGSVAGMVAVPATLMVANHLVPSLLGNKTRKPRITRRHTRRHSSH